MAQRVFFHVGTLKTGTTYLQQVMWTNRVAMREAGTLFAGRHYRDRVWAARTVRGRKNRKVRAASAWDRIVAQVQRFDGDVIISHEFFGGASAEQAAAAMAALAPAEVHVVVTTRDLVGILPALWQERVKFGYTERFADFDSQSVGVGDGGNFSWRTIDAADVLRRWGAGLPSERVHVVTMPPPGSPRDLLWRRFAEACGFDPAIASADLPSVNESMGVAEAELLRRVNTGLHEPLRRPPEPARWVRGYLGLGILARRDGEKLLVTPERAAALRERSIAIADEIRRAGYHVVGDLDDIVGPLEPPTSRQPEEVEDSELLAVAIDVINTMLADHRELSRENSALKRDLGSRRVDAPPPGVPSRSLPRRVVRRLRRLGAQSAR